MCWKVFIIPLSFTDLHSRCWCLKKVQSVKAVGFSFKKEQFTCLSVFLHFLKGAKQWYWFYISIGIIEYHFYWNTRETETKVKTTLFRTNTIEGITLRTNGNKVINKTWVLPLKDLHLRRLGKKDVHVPIIRWT